MSDEDKIKELILALNLAKDMLIANDVLGSYTNEVILNALKKAAHN